MSQTDHGCPVGGSVRLPGSARRGPCFMSARRVFTRLCAWLVWWEMAAGLVPILAQDAGAHGTIEGRVISAWDAGPLAGVTVSVRGTTLATVTDAEGRFRLVSVPPGRHVIVLSRSGYVRTVVTDVLVAGGQVSRVEANLRPEFYEREEYVVTAPEMNEQTAQLLDMRRQSAALLDSVGAEQFARLAASDAADILERVPGVTVADGKHPVVRGLNERYVGVLLNGAEMPSPDPYKKSASLDMFPAGLIESVTVAKSFTPDLPGNFAGGGVLLKTRSFPEDFLFRISAGIEFNTRTTFRDDFPTASGGAWDWLGMDDGSRALPEELDRPGLTVPRPVSNSGLPSSPSYASRLADAEELNRLTRLMGSPAFAPTPGWAPPNHSFSLTSGDTVSFRNQAVGWFGGLTYQRKFTLLDGPNNRYSPGLQQTIVPRKLFHDVQGIEEVNWAAVASLAWRPLPEQELTFTFFQNQNADFVARTQRGTITDDPDLTFVLHRLHWTERSLRSFQLNGTHKLACLGDLQLDWLAALSSTRQEEPDARFFHYRTDGTFFEPDHQSLPTPSKPTRYFRDLEEEHRNVKGDLTLPWVDGQGRQWRLRWGGAWSGSRRTFEDREIFYEGQFGRSAAFPFLGDANAFLSEGSLGYTAVTNADGRVRYTWNRYIGTRESRYEAEQTIPAAYVMAEVPLGSRLRLTAGARFEQTELQADSVSYVANETTGLPENRAALQRQDWLPAAGLTWQIRTNQQVRLHYAHTIARPTFRELAAYRSYDPVTDEILEGNPRLGMTDVRNYDLRWEWFPAPGEVISVSAFYKDLAGAIERQYVNIGGEIVSFVNRPSAEVYGVELELRRGLGFLHAELQNLSLGLNAAWIASSVELSPEEILNRTQFIGDASDTRPLYDQSPYVVNVDLSWELPRSGTTLTMAFNIAGPRIVIAGLATPDVYENPAPSLDLIWDQRLGRHWKLRVTAKNLLDPAIERTYGEGSAAVYNRYHRGRLFGLSLSCEW